MSTSCAIVDTNAGFLLEPNEVMDNVSKKENVCGNRNGDTSLINDEILDSDHRNNFGPSIVKICDGRSDVLEQADQSSPTSLHHDASSFTAPEVSSLNKVDVLGGCNDIKTDNEISMTNVESNSPSTSNHIVYTISDSEDRTAESQIRPGAKTNGPPSLYLKKKRKLNEPYPSRFFLNFGS